MVTGKPTVFLFLIRYGRTLVFKKHIKVLTHPWFDQLLLPRAAQSSDCYLDHYTDQDSAGRSLPGSCNVLHQPQYWHTKK